MGESGSFAVAPAIANAIHDAVGVRLTDLPMTPEAVLTAICQAAIAGSEKREAQASSIRIACAPSHSTILPSLGRSSSGDVMVMK